MRIILRNSICLLFSVILLNSCLPAQGKHTPKVYIVEINQMKFQPAELTVLSTDTIVWINKDMVSHNVTEEVSKSWTSSLLSPGQSWKTVVTKSSDYYCSIHPIMKGKITVVSSP